MKRNVVACRSYSGYFWMRSALRCAKVYWELSLTLSLGASDRQKRHPLHATTPVRSRGQTWGFVGRHLTSLIWLVIWLLLCSYGSPYMKTLVPWTGAKQKQYGVGFDGSSLQDFPTALVFRYAAGFLRYCQRRFRVFDVNCQRFRKSLSSADFRASYCCRMLLPFRWSCN